jgi:hypothetical protein
MRLLPNRHRVGAKRRLKDKPMAAWLTAHLRETENACGPAALSLKFKAHSR